MERLCDPAHGGKRCIVQCRENVMQNLSLKPCAFICTPKMLKKINDEKQPFYELLTNGIKRLNRPHMAPGAIAWPYLPGATHFKSQTRLVGVLESSRWVKKVDSRQFDQSFNAPGWCVQDCQSTQHG